MPISKVSNFVLVPQRADGVCWCASLMMLHQWAKASGKTMKDPLSDAGTKDRWDNNKDWAPSDNGWLANLMGLKTPSDIPRDYIELNKYLTAHGPVWSAGNKTWSGTAHGHVVVVAGVADTGVWILDPEPVGFGSSLWLTWDQYKTFVDGTKATVKFMTVL